MLRSVSDIRQGHIFMLRSVSDIRQGHIFMLRSVSDIRQGHIFMLRSVSDIRQGHIFMLFSEVCLCEYCYSIYQLPICNSTLYCKILYNSLGTGICTYLFVYDF